MRRDCFIRPAHIVLVLFLFLPAFLLIAQEEAPPEPEVELPELSIRFDEEFSEELPLFELDIDEALSDSTSGSLELEEEIEFRPGELELAAPSFDALPYGTDSAPLYGRGYIGFGSSNALRGEVEIATLGADPGFALSYLHNSLDGFGGNAPGEGFTVRREEVRGEASYGPSADSLGFNGSFIEEERGLQGESVYSSVLRRSSAVDLSFEHLPSRGWYGSGALSFDGTYQNLSAPLPEDTAHYTIGPSLEAGYGWERFSLGLEGLYALRSAPEELLHYGALSAALTGDLGPRIGFNARLGGAFLNGETPRLPADLRISAGVSRDLTVELAGGYFFRLAEYASLLERYPFVRIPDEPAGVEEGWEADLSLRLRLGEGLYLTAGSGFTAADLYRAGENPEAASPLLPLEAGRSL